MADNPLKTLHARLRAAAMPHKGRYKVIAYDAGISVHHFRSLLFAPRGVSLPTVWALAKALGVDPYWLLGSDAHSGPEPVTGDVPPQALQPEVWALVHDHHLRGYTWRNVTKLVAIKFGVSVNQNSLRRAYLKKFSTGACKD